MRFAVSPIDVDDEFILILPSELPIDRPRLDIIGSLKQGEDENEKLLSKLARYSERHNLRDKRIRIGQNEYLIMKKLGSGAEGLVFTAKGPNDTTVVVKAILQGAPDTKESYDNEVHALRMLDRLLDYDDKHMVLVETMISGESLDVELIRYTEEHVGENELPSDYIPLHLKVKYFQILWDFRNKTNMVHGDFRPYNVIGGQLIDFGRTKPLSRNLRIRQKQLKRDDNHAVKEWNWFYCFLDWEKIEQNPLMPNAIKRAEEIWEIYINRYHHVKKHKKYKAAWMEVLKRIHDTNDTTLEFPISGDFTDD